jgi:glucosyl-dolichyl phosphate glucuronosyltransferase
VITSTLNEVCSPSYVLARLPLDSYEVMAVGGYSADDLECAMWQKVSSVRQGCGQKGNGMTALSVSVVICAHTEKRWDDILAATVSVLTQSHAAKELIVVVDHNPRLYQRLKAALPDATVIENYEKPGLSGGRNTGVAHAAGEIVAFLDDDAAAEPDWLRFLVDAYSDPAVAGVGGLTLPLWDRGRPSWFPPEFDWVVGCSYLGMSAHGNPVRNLLGANASFRREIFAQVGGFTSGLGRSAAKLPLGCEETEFCIRIGQQMPDKVLVTEGGAVVQHRVPEVRSRFSYFRARCYAEGRSKAMVSRSVGTHDGLSAERRYAIKTLPLGVARGLTDAMHGRGAGFARAGAIIVGFAYATVGYAIGAIRNYAIPRNGSG